MTKARTWSQKLTVARTMRESAGETAYDRVQLLMEIYDDRDFLSRFPEEERREDVLDKCTDDLCASFCELREMMRFNDDRAHWAKGNLGTLRIDTMAHLAEEAANRRNGEPKRVHRIIKQSEFKQVQDELKGEKLRSNTLQDSFQTQAQRTAELERENSALKLENAELKGRNSELERLVNRELASA